MAMAMDAGREGGIASIALVPKARAKMTCGAIK